MKRHSLIASVLIIVLPYIILGSVWIVFSDRLLLSMSDDPPTMIFISTIKGWVYVLLTGVLLLVLVFRELRSRAALETQLRNSLVDKDALLLELNHRVKNNLQVISSILNLEMENIEGAEACALNDRSRTRIQAMSLAYERLFESGDIARIDLGEYLRDLWTVLTGIYETKAARVSFALENIVMGADEAVPFGLFATEAITNAILYGAERSKGSDVAIGLRALDGGDAELTVRDKGPGLPAGAEGLGLKLMDALGAQLRGRAEYFNEGGAVVRLRFAIPGPQHV